MEELEQTMPIRAGVIKGLLAAIPLGIRAWLLWRATEGTTLGGVVGLLAVLAIVVPVLTPKAFRSFLRTLMTPKQAMNLFYLAMVVIWFPMVNEILVFMPIKYEALYYQVIIPLGSALFGSLGIIAVTSLSLAEFSRLSSR